MNNDFKDAYKSEMDRITPSMASIEKLQDAMTEKKTRRITPASVRRIIAVAASVAILVGAAIPTALHFKGNDPLTPSGIVPPSTSINSVNLTNYDDIYEAISDIVKNNRGKEYYLYNGMLEDGAIDITTAIPEGTTGTLTGGLDTMAPAATAPIPGLKGEAAGEFSESEMTPEFSDTNLQEAGVQEADIIKTDGRYIYAISNEYLYIVKAEDGELTLISKISRRTDADASAPYAIDEMYVLGDRLIVIKSVYELFENEVIYYTPEIKGDVYYTVPTDDVTLDTAAETMPAYIPDGMVVAAPDFVVGRPRTHYQYVGRGADIYDISDRANPTLINSFTQDGGYVASRMIGDVLYLVTNKYVSQNISITDPSTFVPLVDGDLLAPECIYIAKDTASASNSNYLVVTGIDTSGKGEMISSKSVFGCGYTVYCSENALYVSAGTSQTKDDVFSNATKIYKFSLDAGKVDFVAEGTVPGTLLNQFSLDEENGYLRLVSTFQSWKREVVENGEYTYVSQTDYKKCNCLYVLDDTLTVVGALEDLAPDEQIYSARFEGDIAYFVTFRQTDPLFTVDLSDPTAPKILSELKIPGFSEYLHPWSDGLLFGFGKYANPNTGRAGELKLSMFDVSDKTNVSEAHTLTVSGYSYSSASYNHKAILINAAKNIIAFPAENGRYLVYSYDEENGFEKLSEIYISDKIAYCDLRGLFIGDYLYVISPVSIASYDMTSYTFKASVHLD